MLDQDLRLARDFQPLTDPERSALLARTAPAARGGRWGRYKTAREFDGTFQNPQWLGPKA